MPQAVIVVRSKLYKEAAKKAITDPVAIDQAVDVLKSFNPTKFDQSVELIFSLSIDPKQADQMIRGSVSLPHGIGKTKRVVAFCPEHLAAGATAAGAGYRGAGSEPSVVWRSADGTIAGHAPWPAPGAVDRSQGLRYVMR